MTGTGGLQIVRAIVDLAHNLHLDVVAEGIETEHQLAVLRTVGCEHGQGFLFAAPLDSAAAHELIIANLSVDVPAPSGTLPPPRS
jgi:EAL domain-containing protein (putative c-di-GMP-specific phosphodiesterase class I)